MQKPDPELLEQIRQQFDSAPYPRIPLEDDPKNNYELLFVHNLVTPYYLKYKTVINTEGKVILDAGCGTGYKSLVLAEANPGAKIVGIDISEQSVELARQRLKYYGFNNAEFYVLPIENLPQIGYQFDYINADEVLYLLPDIVRALKAMKLVLQPEGMIRTNLHSVYRRFNLLKAQSLFKLMGLMEGTPGEMEITIARETIQSLKNQVLFKSQAWEKGLETHDEWVLMNYFLQGDKGFTIPEVFEMLKVVELEMINMVNWRQWEPLDLFQDPDNLPAFLAFSLPELSIEHRLHFFELLHPVHRLLDFWCGHPINTTAMDISNWTQTDWETATVYLHPQLTTDQAKQDLIECIRTHRPYEISQYVKLPTLVPLNFESRRASCLLPLWEGKQSMMSLVERWKQIQPVDPVTLELMSDQMAFEQVKELLSDLEPFLYILLECSL